MKNNVRRITTVGVLSALSVVLMIFPKFPIIPAFPFLEVDFSDVPALIAAAMFSPCVGVLISLVKNMVHLVMTSTGGVGELSNFICGGTFVLVFGTVFRRLRLKMPSVHVILSLAIGAVSQICAAVLGNYYLMIPLYGIESAAASYILGGVIPFNAVKDLLVSAAAFVVYMYLGPHLRRFFE